MTDHLTLPPRWRNRGRWTRAELVGVAIACAAGIGTPIASQLVPHSPTGAPRFAWPMILIGSGFLVTVAGLALWFRSHLRAAADLLACNLRMCLNCRYPLPDQPGEGACPECGCRYSPEELSTGWGATYPSLRVNRAGALGESPRPDARPRT